MKKRIDEIQNEKKISHMYAQWLGNRNNGLSLVHYLNDKGYRRVAIYGFGECGRLIFDEIKNDIEFCYAIDKKAYSIYAEDVEVLMLTDVKYPTDVVIVSIVSSFDEIKKECNKMLSCPVISVEEIVNDLEVYI